MDPNGLLDSTGAVGAVDRGVSYNLVKWNSIDLRVNAADNWNGRSSSVVVRVPTRFHCPQLIRWSPKSYLDEFSRQIISSNRHSILWDKFHYDRYSNKQQ